MADTGWVKGGASSSQARGGSSGSWTSPANGVSADTGTTQWNPGFANGYSPWLRVNGFDMSIPAAATIDGIEVRIRKDFNPGFGNDPSDDSLRLWDGTAVTGNDKATGTSYPSTLTWVTAGGPSDTWGTSLEVSAINASSFGYQLSVSAPKFVDAFIDGMQMRVTYTVDVSCPGGLCTAFVSSPEFGWEAGSPALSGPAIIFPVEVDSAEFGWESDAVSISGDAVVTAETPEFVQAAEDNGNATFIAVNSADGWATPSQGNFLVAYVYTLGFWIDGFTSANNTVSMNSGWTEVVHKDHVTDYGGGEGESERWAMYYKFAGANENSAHASHTNINGTPDFPFAQLSLTEFTNIASADVVTDSLGLLDVSSSTHTSMTVSAPSDRQHLFVAGGFHSVNAEFSPWNIAFSSGYVTATRNDDFGIQFVSYKIGTSPYTASETITVSATAGVPHYVFAAFKGVATSAGGEVAVSALPDNAEFGWEAQSTDITQVHVLPVNPAEVGFEISSIGVTEVIDLPVVPAEFGFEISTPDVDVAVATIGVDVFNYEAGWEVGAPSLTQVQVVPVVNLEAGYEAQSVDLVQTHTLGVINAELGFQAGSVALTQAHSISPGGSEYGWEAGSVGLDYIYELTVVNAELGHEIDSISVLKVIGITPVFATLGWEADSVDIVQQYTITASGPEIGHEIGSVDLSQLHLIGMGNSNMEMGYESQSLGIRRFVYGRTPRDRIKTVVQR